MGLKQLIAFFALCSIVSAADPTGTIAGTILDPSGAPVANARITATALAACRR